MPRKIIFLLFFFCFISSCIESYNVNVKQYEDLLVVDGLITNENKSHQIKLTRSIGNLDETPKVETNAVIRIQCSDGTEEILKEIEPGIYKTDSLQFVVKVGNIYKLFIDTSSGKSYSSDECEILEPTEIDKIYYNKNEVVDINNETIEGVDFYVDGKVSSGSYLRWIYEEDWKFSIPYPVLIGFDENKKVIFPPVENVYCWKKSSSNEIIIQSLQHQNTIDIKDKKVCFISSDNTDRFTHKYAINIKQLNISQDEYEYWSKLKKTSEDVGDISGTQPFTVMGNVKSNDDINEPVLGYFQTGSVTTKRVFVDYNDVSALNLSLRNSKRVCEVDTVMKSEVEGNLLYDIYEEYVLNGDFAVHDQTDFGGGLLLSSRDCCDCSLTGSSKKPSFWED